MNDIVIDVSQEKLFQKLCRFLRKAMRTVAEPALVLYYAFRQPETPLRAKCIILSALGYGINPFDGIPDLIPAVGYTDDLLALAAALTVCAAHVNDEVRARANETLRTLFGEEA